ncbi:MAG: hypothetical protein ACUBOA_12010 [Candidatus Loosdrechtia sp.]|uniref:hypothetical protein n=1 Tax=Candidatus Loosdrechtia sp. TaxID=3101272 RepID=UPI003A70D041|nr:MAG: hypothetical protein QY305_12585 [Candidatus Jettenia sp. AMX2]
MSKINKVIACIQIVIFLSLMLCSSGVTTMNSLRKPDEFPCKDHDCGCKSADDCRTNCCCFPQGNHPGHYHSAKKQKSSLQSFISSLKCKSGSAAMVLINTEFKCIMEDYFVIPHITFLCFLASDTLTRLREVMVSPPEKPPRYPA